MQLSPIGFAGIFVTKRASSPKRARETATLFYCTEKGKSYAEMTEDEKNSVSHRAKAMAGFLDKFLAEIK